MPVNDNGRLFYKTGSSTESVISFVSISFIAEETAYFLSFFGLCRTISLLTAWILRRQKKRIRPFEFDSLMKEYSIF